MDENIYEGIFLYRSILHSFFIKNERRPEMEVYDILFPKDEKYKGSVHLAVMTKNKELKSLGSCFFDNLQERIEQLDISKERNYYITANTTMQYTPRRSCYLFSLNNIVLDFDAHNIEDEYFRNEIISSFIFRIKRDLFYISEPFRVPEPSVIHKTGRGVQIYWHIHSTSAYLLFLYHRVIDKFEIIFRNFLSEYPLLEENIEIDVGASKNAVGLFRLFDTYNTHTGKKTEAEILYRNGYDLNELHKILCNVDIVKEHYQRIEQKTNHSSHTQNKKTKYHNTSYAALNRKRLAFIKWWSDMQDDSIGKRNNMIYLAYNSAIQVMTEEESKKWCLDLNNSFTLPLKSIEYIFKEIKEPFKIKNDTFYEMLGASEEEVQRFEKEYSKQTVNLTRNTERKKPQEEKEQKKDRAREMLQNGDTYQHIADEVGLSVSTIARLSAEMDESRKSKEKTWETLGISRATYYRKIKQTPS